MNIRILAALAALALPLIAQETPPPPTTFGESTLTVDQGTGLIQAYAYVITSDPTDDAQSSTVSTTTSCCGADF